MKRGAIVFFEALPGDKTLAILIFTKVVLRGKTVRIDPRDRYGGDMHHGKNALPMTANAYP
jgi:hypothetical protein